MTDKNVNAPDYWQHRYEEGTTGWDAGSITEPLKVFFEGLRDKHIKILIPGAGNAWEAEWLHRHGFDQVYVIDIASAPLQNLLKRVPDFPQEHLIQGGFFSHEGMYDLIIEQTFFCAVDPSLRKSYAVRMAGLLRPGGNLAGVLFDCEFEGGPPFGGSGDEYRGYFESLFDFRVFEPCRNSIGPRSGKELFILLERKAS